MTYEPCDCVKSDSAPQQQESIRCRVDRIAGLCESRAPYDCKDVVNANMSISKGTYSALAAAVIFPAVAGAGTYVESTATNHFTPQAQTVNMKMWAGNGRFRMESHNGQQVQIFKDQAIYVLNAGAKTYSKMDKAAMDAMNRKVSEARENLEALLPPDQRKKKQPESKPKSDRTVKATGRTESSAIGQTCKVWEVFSNGAKVQEQCVVEIASVPAGKDLFTAIEKVGAAFEGTAAASGMAEVSQDMKTMNGFPVITRIYVNGKLLQEMKTTSIKSAATPDSMFVIPPGFTQKELGDI